MASENSSGSDPFNNLAPTTTNNPTKTYQIVNNHTFTTKHLEIHHHNQPILWANTKSQMFHNPIINLSTEGETGPIIAACKLESFSKSVRYCVGNPDCTDKNTWPVCECEGFLEKAYTLRLNNNNGGGGGAFQWKRTHDKALGASTFGSKNFKLVDMSGRVLAVHIHTQSLLKGKFHDIARIDYFGELGEELEVSSLVTMLGIQEKIRRSERSSSGGGGGGA